MRKIRLVSVLALVLALAFVPAGCGKDADNDSTGGKVPDIFDNNTPDTPANPDTPATPDTPVNPDTPANPDTPVNPDTPANPDTPVNPAPGGNDTSAKPDEPVVCVEHIFEEAERKDSTCTADGSVKYLCKVCNAEGYERLYANHKVENNKCTLCNLEAATNLQFTLTADDTAFEVTGIGSSDYVDIIVPSHVAGLPVVKVSGLKDARKVHLPETVTTIGENTFKEGRLESIYIPASVVEIGANAFCGCKNLVRVRLPESITTIGAGAFKNCVKLTEINIPASVTEFSDEMLHGTKITTDMLGDLSRISYFGTRFWRLSENIGTLVLSEGATLGAYAFENCKIDEIVLPHGITEIPDGAFLDADIQKITIPDGVKRIGKEAFRACYSLESIILPDSVTEIDEGAFYRCGALAEINMPANLETIGACAFENCDKLTSIDIPTTVKKIGNEAFSGTGIKTLVLDHELDVIGWQAFSGSALESVTYNGSKESGMEIFYECGKLTNVTIGDKVKIIPERAFASSNIIFITIPGSVEVIGYGAFESCYNLQKVTINEGLKEIGQYAFAFCNNLKKLQLPASIEKLDSLAFRGSALENITLPAGLKEVGTGLFYECENLTHVYCEAAQPLFDVETLREYDSGNSRQGAYWGEIVLGSTGE